MMPRALGLVILLGTAGAAGTSATGCGATAGPRAGKGVVRFTAPQRDVGVWIDDRYIGVVEAYRAGVALRAGPHRFEFRHDDFFPRYVDVTVRAGETLRLEVDLAPLVP